MTQVAIWVSSRVQVLAAAHVLGLHLSACPCTAFAFAVLSENAQLKEVAFETLEAEQSVTESCQRRHALGT